MRTPLLLCCALVLLLTAPPHHVAAAAAQPTASASRIRVQWVSDLELHLDPRHPCTAALGSGAIVAEGSRERRRHALRRAAALPRRALLVSDAQAQAQLDDLDKQAGALAASLLDAVHVGLAAADGRPGGSATAPATGSAPSPAAPTLSGFFANSLDAINRRAPVIHMPDGYSIKPRVRSELMERQRGAGLLAPARAPDAWAHAAPAGAAAPQGRRQLLQGVRGPAGIPGAGGGLPATGAGVPVAKADSATARSAQAALANLLASAAQMPPADPSGALSASAAESPGALPSAPAAQVAGPGGPAAAAAAPGAATTATPRGPVVVPGGPAVVAAPAGGVATAAPGGAAHAPGEPAAAALPGTPAVAPAAAARGTALVADAAGVSGSANASAGRGVAAADLAAGPPAAQLAMPAGGAGGGAAIPVPPAAAPLPSQSAAAAGAAAQGSGGAAGAAANPAARPDAAGGAGRTGAASRHPAPASDSAGSWVMAALGGPGSGRTGPREPAAGPAGGTAKGAAAPAEGPPARGASAGEESGSRAGGAPANPPPAPSLPGGGGSLGDAGLAPGSGSGARAEGAAAPGNATAGGGGQPSDWAANSLRRGTGAGAPVSGGGSAAAAPQLAGGAGGAAGGGGQAGGWAANSLRRGAGGAASAAGRGAAAAAPQPAGGAVRRSAALSAVAAKDGDLIAQAGPFFVRNETAQLNALAEQNREAHQVAAKAHAAAVAAAEKARNATEYRAGGYGQGSFPGTLPHNRTAVGNVTIPAGNPQSTLQKELQPRSQLNFSDPASLPAAVRQANAAQLAASGFIPSSAGQGATQAGPLRTSTLQSAGGSDPLPQGANIGILQGVRIATPFFGTGYNFCIDRYFGSFPKVGIVIPNPGTWLLPEFQDLAARLETTLMLPPNGQLSNGISLQPDSDGFLVFLPSVQPSIVPDFAFRYGIQIGQAFGLDFGIGLIRDICFVSFAIV